MVLVVEDEASARVVLAELLRRWHYRVVLAATGSEAIAAVQQRMPDLVLTDVMMPEMDGIELVQWLRERHPGLPVIAMSSGGRMAASFVLKMAASLGAAYVLAKPFSALELELGLNRLLGGRARPEATG